MTPNTLGSEIPINTPKKKDLFQILKNRHIPQTTSWTIDLASKLGIFLTEVEKLVGAENPVEKLDIRSDDLYSLISKPNGIWAIQQNRKGKVREFEVSKNTIYQESMMVRDRSNDGSSSLPIAISLKSESTKYFVEWISDNTQQIQIPYENMPEFMAELRKIVGKIAILCDSRKDQADLITTIEESCKIKNISGSTIVTKWGLIAWISSYLWQEKNQLPFALITKTIRGIPNEKLSSWEQLNNRGELTKGEATQRVVNMLQGAIERQVSLVQKPSEPTK